LIGGRVARLRREAKVLTVANLKEANHFEESEIVRVKVRNKREGEKESEEKKKESTPQRSSFLDEPRTPSQPIQVELSPPQIPQASTCFTENGF